MTEPPPQWPWGPGSGFPSVLQLRLCLCYSKPSADPGPIDMPLWKVQAFDMQNQYSRSDFLNFRICVIVDEVRSFKRNGLRGRFYAGCRTGSVLVLEPIFESDLEPEQFGSTIGLCRSTTGKSYIGTRPSGKKVKRLCRTISEQTSRRWGLLDVMGAWGVLPDFAANPPPGFSEQESSVGDILKVESCE